MSIILGMAGVTIGGQVGEVTINVTLGTSNHGMGTGQREF
jgi:hypothetical protein